jgi:disulfide bond formation protein DsbB
MAGTKAPCEVCRLIRGYLLMFVPMLIMLALIRLGGKDAAPLVQVDLAKVLAWGIALALVGQVAWKAYHEFGPGRRR